MSRLRAAIGRLSRLSPRQMALLVFCTALAARMLFSVGFQTWVFYDRWQYAQEIGHIGRWLAETGDFVVEEGKQTSKFPPVYPFIVASAFRIGGVFTEQSALLLYLFQSVCAGLAAIALMTLGSRVFNRTAGMVAGFGWALYPSSLFESTAVIWYSELSILMVLGLLLVATSPRPARSIGRFALLGSLAGILVLTDSSMLVYVAVIPVWMLMSRKVTWRTAAWCVLAWSIAAMAALSPWAIRNWRMFGTPSVLKSNFDLELFFGNNPYSSGGTLDSERNKALAALPPDELARAQNGPEAEYFKFLGRHARQWIAEHPAQFVKLTAIRFWYYWGKYPSFGPDRFRHYSWFHLAWYLPVLFLAVAGALNRAYWSPELVLLLLFLAIYPLPYYVTHVQLYRYRYPVEPLLVLLAAVPAAAWLGARPMAHKHLAAS